jgi:CheY-like chemotaxis protein
MIVDDHDDTRATYASAMSSAGWLVEAVRDSKAALVQAASFAPDVIVMDPHLPLSEGLDATRRLRSEAPTSRVPIVICISAISTEVRARVPGCTVFVVEPFDAGALCRMLEDLVTGGE